MGVFVSKVIGHVEGAAVCVTLDVREFPKKEGVW